MHYRIPILPGEHLKHGDERPEQRVEVVSRSLAVVQSAHFTSEELHAEQREDEDGEYDDEGEVAQVEHGEVHCVQKFCRLVQLRMSFRTRRMRNARRAVRDPDPAAASSMMEMSTTTASKRLKLSLAYSVNPIPPTLSTSSKMNMMVRMRLHTSSPLAYPEHVRVFHAQ